MRLPRVLSYSLFLLMALFLKQAYPDVVLKWSSGKTTRVSSIPPVGPVYRLVVEDTLAYLNSNDDRSPQVFEGKNYRGRLCGLDIYLALALVEKESGFNPLALSSKKALGFTQLMPKTGRDLRVNRSSPQSNILGGLNYLRSNLCYFREKAGKKKGWKLGIAAYFAGPEAIIKAKYAIPRRYYKTKRYAKRVPALRARLIENPKRLSKFQYTRKRWAYLFKKLPLSLLRASLRSFRREYSMLSKKLGAEVLGLETIEPEKKGRMLTVVLDYWEAIRVLQARVLAKQRNVDSEQYASLFYKPPKRSSGTKISKSLLRERQNAPKTETQIRAQRRRRPARAVNSRGSTSYSKQLLRQRSLQKDQTK